GEVRAIDATAGLRLVRPVLIGVSILTAIGAAAMWDTFLFYGSRTDFAATDPIFARNIGWYVFTLPALTGFFSIVRSLLTFALATVALVYFVRGDVVLLPRGLRVVPTAGRHLGALLALLFVLTAADLWYVDASSLLFSTSGPLVGAGYADLHALLPALRVSAVVALLGAVVVTVGAMRGQLGWYAFLAVGTYALVGIVGRGAIPQLVQKFVVTPTELTRESPYLAHHIDATRKAWSLDSVEVRDLAGETQLTLADLRNNGPTLENV